MSDRSRLSRRGLVAGAAWTAPVIVVAGAAPAYALSGPANVVTVIEPPVLDGSDLTVNFTFVNRNTRSTGLVTVAVYFAPTFGNVPAGSPVINAADSSPGWTYIGSGGNASERSFSFSLPAPGIPGASTPTGTGTPILLSITLSVTPAGGLSAGQIRTLNVVQSGDMPPANSAWGPDVPVI